MVYSFCVTDAAKIKPTAEIHDQWIRKFLAHLATDRDASVYTQRNYRQALLDFFHWHHVERQQSPAWEKLQRDDFRGYLRFLGRQNLGRAAIQLRFCALRTFFKFLIRQNQSRLTSAATVEGVFPFCCISR